MSEVPAPYGETDMNSEMQEMQDEMQDEMQQADQQQKTEHAQQFDGILDKVAQDLTDNERSLRDDGIRHKDMKSTLQELQANISNLLQ